MKFLKSPTMIFIIYLSAKSNCLENSFPEGISGGGGGDQRYKYLPPNNNSVDVNNYLSSKKCFWKRRVHTGSKYEKSAFKFNYMKRFETLGSFTIDINHFLEIPPILPPCQPFNMHFG